MAEGRPGGSSIIHTYIGQQHLLASLLLSMLPPPSQQQGRPPNACKASEAWQCMAQFGRDNMRQGETVAAAAPSEAAAVLWRYHSPSPHSPAPRSAGPHPAPASPQVRRTGKPQSDTCGPSFTMERPLCPLHRFTKLRARFPHAGTGRYLLGSIPSVSTPLEQPHPCVRPHPAPLVNINAHSLPLNRGRQGGHTYMQLLVLSLLFAGD